MLIEIDISIKEYIQKNINDMNQYSNEIEILEALARANSNKNHMIIANRDVLKYLSKLEILNDRCKRIYSNLYNKSSKYKALKKSFKQYVIIKSDEFRITIEEDGDQKIYKVPLRYFKDEDYLTKAVLLTENLRDVHLYKAMAEKYINQVKGENINIGLRLEGNTGGGNDLYMSFEEIISNNRLCLCISDSDKEHPNDTSGDTSRQAWNVYQNNKLNKIIYMHELKVREKENLIPPSLYKLCDNGINHESLKRLLRLEKERQNSEILKYIDIKDGISLKKYKKSKDKHKDYLDNIIEECPYLIACDLENEENDDVKIIEGIGSSAIENLRKDIFENNIYDKLKEKEKAYSKYKYEGIKDEIDSIKSKIETKENIFKDLPEYIESEWIDLCEIIIAWGCVDSFRAI